MAFIRDAWYCAGFTVGLKAGELKPLTILNEAVVLYRQSDGAAKALADRCPHRFAPLSKGKICDREVQCGYHGLRFNADGHCTHNPHGDGSIPKAATVRAYPVLERHGALWIWMGEPAQADPGKLPDFSEVEQRPGWTRVEGYLHVRANYQLMIDNLLDLSHVPFLHPFLGGGAPPPPEFRPDIRMETQGDAVVAISEFHSMPNTPLYQMLWERGAPPDIVDMRANITWHPPSMLMLDTGAKPVDQPREHGPSAPIAHWLTPETETTTHYFWAQARDRFVGNDEVSAQIAAGIDGAFRNEDEPMIEACQQNMGTADLMSLKPLLLQTDGPAVRARRVIQMKLESGRLSDR
jgi:phenylpropionate dioxygenase-like ring-hydroxylating dioxygenase large terminal subunit